MLTAKIGIWLSQLPLSADDPGQPVPEDRIPPVSITDLDGVSPIYVPLLDSTPEIGLLNPAEEFVRLTTPIFLVLAVGFLVLVGLGFLSLRKDWRSGA